MKGRRSIIFREDDLADRVADLMASSPFFATMMKAMRPTSWREDIYKSGRKRITIRATDSDGSVLTYKMTVG